MTQIWHGGTEVPGWRTLLQAEGVRHCAISFTGLARRVKFARPWLLAKKFEPDTHILLDSGGYSINKNPDKYPREKILDLGEKYVRFTTDNIDRVEWVTDFDVTHAAGLRPQLQELAGEKYVPIWHAEEGMPSLRDMAATYGRLAVTQTSVRGRDIVPELRRLAASGVQLHGLAMTKPAVIAALPWTSVVSTSWLAPAQYGSFTVWTGLRLQRYNRDLGDAGRRQYRHLLHREGFDTDLIEAGDATENLRVSIWSWLQYAKVVNTHRETTNMDFAENAHDTPDTEGTESGKKVVVTNHRQATEVLPGFGVRQTDAQYIDADGVYATRTVDHMEVSAESQRLCDTCFLSKACQGFEPGATCKYNLPISADSPEHAHRIRAMNIEIQMQRVAEVRRYEQLEGGFADPNVSREINLLDNMIARYIASMAAGFKATEQVQGRQAAGASMFAQIFGDKASTVARALEAHIPADDIMRDLGVVEAEVLYEE